MRSGCLRRLTTVHLAHSGLSELGDLTAVASTLTSARELDLSYNRCATPANVQRDAC